jgi:membrane associated rhomboid family serine protease
MMIAPATAAVLLVTAVATLVAFQNDRLYERWMFKPREILAGREFDRMLTSGLIHVDWPHFIFNAYSFYSFGETIEIIYGAKILLLVHFSAILGGSLLSLLIHRHQDYRAVGASGGVCGVIFASIFLLPGGGVRPLMFPIHIPAYAYAIAFLVFSFIGLRRHIGNVGHDAHLGGAIIGLLVATALYPSVVMAEPGLFAAVLVISVVILLAIIFDPLHLLEHRIEFGGLSAGDERSRRYESNRRRNQKMAEIDRLLDKMAKHGANGLSKSERQRLDQLSKEVSGSS